jgi:predicted sulfurtransferase
MKSSVDRTDFKEGAVLQSSLVLFYQYVVPQWSTKRVDELTAYLSRIAHLRGIGGRIRIAPEGVNATVSCAGIASARAIRHFTLDLQQFDPKAFAKTDFKFVDQLQIDRHFKEVKLLPVQELVFYGISSKEAPLDKGGIHLEPNEYHEMLKQ